MRGRRARGPGQIEPEERRVMPVEIIGMVGTRDASEIKGPLVDGPVVDWMDGPVIDPGYLVDIARAHDDGGFDRVLVGYGAVAPEGWAVAATVLHSTEHLKVMVAHRPGHRAAGHPGPHGGHAGPPDRRRADRHPLHHRRRRGRPAPRGRLRAPRRALRPDGRGHGADSAPLDRGRPLRLRRSSSSATRGPSAR